MKRKTRTAFQMDKENFRFFIKVYTALYMQSIIILDELCTVFDDEALSFRTVAKWAKYFCEGREEINDEAQSERSLTVTTSENVEEIQSIINILQQKNCKNKLTLVMALLSLII